MNSAAHRHGPLRWALAMACATTLLVGSVNAQSNVLDKVPADAAGLLHLRVSDVWQHEVMKGTRELIDLTEPQALQTLKNDFSPDPTTLESVTTILLPPQFEDFEDVPPVVTFLRFNKPFDQKRTVLQFLSKSKTDTIAGQKVFLADDQFKPTALAIIDQQTLLIGEKENFEKFFAMKPGGQGGLAPAIKLAQQKHLLIAINVAALPIPQNFGDALPPEFRAVGKAQLVTLDMELKDDIEFRAGIQFPDQDAANQGMQSIKNALALLGQEMEEGRRNAQRALTDKTARQRAKDTPRPLEELPNVLGAVAALAFIKRTELILQNPPLAVQENQVVFEVTVPPYLSQYVATSSLFAGLLLPAVQGAREAAMRTHSMNNMKQIALAMHNYHDVYGSLPAAAITSKDGKPLLSWRVAILPFIEQQPIYEQFRLDEPWDSEHNKKLIPLMPPVYHDPRQSEPRDKGLTYAKLFVGKDAGFELKKGRKLIEIKDGTSNTIMAVVGGEPTIWTKPEDIPYDPEKPLPELFKPFNNLIAAFIDGSVRYIDPPIDQKVLRAFITHDGGEVINYP